MYGVKFLPMLDGIFDRIGLVKLIGIISLVLYIYPDDITLRTYRKSL